MSEATNAIDQIDNQDQTVSNSRVIGRRGLLDIKMTLSNPDPTAGSEFTVYVLVTNLFDVPIWLDAPQVFLPSEMQPKSSRKSIEDSIENLSILFEQVAKGQSPIVVEPKSRFLKIFSNDTSKIRVALKSMVLSVESLNEDLKAIEDKITGIRQQVEVATAEKSFSERLEMIKTNEELRELSNKEVNYSKQADQIREHIKSLTTQIVALTGSSTIIADGDLIIKNLKPSRIYVQAGGNVDISMSTDKLVSLDSSLQPGSPLQPGNTVVYSIALNTTRQIFFRPIQYALQYSINFSFELGGERHTNTAEQQLTIRAPIVSVMTGAIVGGAAGFFTTFFQNLSKTSPGEILSTNWLQGIILLVLTVILSAMAVVFLARKSETQSLVSIEDFWGGLVIGFLVGYSGTSFFESLAGISGV